MEFGIPRGIIPGRARRNPGTVERPFWAARVENEKNRRVGLFLRGLGWDLRLQPYHGYGTPRRLRLLARVLYASPRTPADFHDQPVTDMRSMAVRGWRNFVGQVAPDRTVHASVGGREFTMRADRTGLVDELLDVDLEPGRHEVRMWTARDNAVTADVTIVDPECPVGVVSDIDDTVMVTWLPRPMLAFWNAFVIHQSSRKPVPGMPGLYQRIAREHPSAPFVYLSTGAWNVFPVLRRFLYKNGYPEGPLLLTDWGPTNTGFFRSGPEHKTRSLERLREALPGMRWILIGDDGQHDPQIYGDFASRHPESVEVVAIRQLTAPEQLLAHGTRRPMSEMQVPAPAQTPPKVEAPDGHGLEAEFEQLGVLRPLSGPIGPAR